LGAAEVDIACNWRTITYLRNSKRELLPDFEVLRQGIKVSDNCNSVLIRLPERPELDLMEMRNWVTSRARGKFKMFNRFRFEEQRIRVEKTYVGVNFLFEDDSDACLFKITFW